MTFSGHTGTEAPPERPYLPEIFQVTPASVPGREHLRLHKSSQDGIAVSETSDLLVAVVTDGCSSGRQSEVGSRLGAAWLAEHLPLYARLCPPGAPSALAEIATAGLVDFLRQTATALSADRALERHLIADLFLFTFIAAVIRRERTAVFGVGDGLICLNDTSRLELDAGPDNAPDYAAYRLLDLPAPAVVHFDTPTDDLDSLIIATDGAAGLLPSEEAPEDPLTELATAPRFLSNPSLVQRHLVALGQRRGPPHLFDDTTLVSVRRRQPEEAP